MAERLSQDLANCGLVIISGMARGIDSIAHKGAIQARGRTIAVFGTGVDIIYPRENRKLSEQILELGGALVSEFPLATGPNPHNFPLRNRIISGLSRGVLVVEAGEFSGTRITSRCALEQCREVFAVPGNVTNKLAWTPNTLIKQGAKLAATWEDVFEELPTDIRLKLQQHQSELPSPRAASLFDPPPAAELPAEQQKVFSAIKPDVSIHIDELIERFDASLSSSEIFTALFELELEQQNPPASRQKLRPSLLAVMALSASERGNLGHWPLPRFCFDQSFRVTQIVTNSSRFSLVISVSQLSRPRRP